MLHRCYSDVSGAGHLKGDSASGGRGLIYIGIDAEELWRRVRSQEAIGASDSGEL
jgi:hypothetical protein